MKSTVNSQAVVDPFHSIGQELQCSSIAWVNSVRLSLVWGIAPSRIIQGQNHFLIFTSWIRIVLAFKTGTSRNLGRVGGEGNAVESIWHVNISDDEMLG